MEKVYIIETPYHLLISIAKTILQKRIGKDIVVIYKENFLPVTIDRLRSIFKSVLCFNTISNFINLLSLKIHEANIPFLSCIAKQNHNIDEHWLQDKDVYIFNDDNYYGCLLNHLKKSYTLIEDGLDCFSLDVEAYVKKNHKKIYSLFGFFWDSFGKSRYAKAIEVNDISKVRVKYPNMVEVNRSLLFKSLSDSEIDIIAHIYDYQPLNIPHKQDCSLLLTQPLSEDRYVDHQKKINIYRHIAKEYAIGTLYIKAHPREKEDYSQIFPNAIIIKNYKIPIELLLLKEKLHFKRVITTFTSAIDAIFCADEKIQMGLEWVKNFK